MVSARALHEKDPHPLEVEVPGILNSFFIDVVFVASDGASVGIGAAGIGWLMIRYYDGKRKL